MKTREEMDRVADKLYEAMKPILKEEGLSGGVENWIIEYKAGEPVTHEIRVLVVEV
jgi:hypothetical protein